MTAKTLVAPAFACVGRQAPPWASHLAQNALHSRSYIGTSGPGAFGIRSAFAAVSVVGSSVIPRRCRSGKSSAQVVLVQNRAFRNPVEGVAAEVHFRLEDRPEMQMSPTKVEDWKGDCLAVFVQEGQPDTNSPEGSRKPRNLLLGVAGDAVDSRLNSLLSRFLLEEDFEAKAGTAKVLPLFDTGVKRIIAVGLGPQTKDIDWRLAGVTAAKTLKTIPNCVFAGVAFDGDAQAQELVEGIRMGLHSDKRMKGSGTPDKEKLATSLERLELIGATPSGCKAACARGQAVASGVIFARELVNAPANVMDPCSMAEAAENLASKVGLTATILDEKCCEAMGMDSFLAVGRCSSVPSKLIHLVYRPVGGAQVKRKIGIVGKGVTFDSGGYNLKVGAESMMDRMKFDMGGAATTLGVAAVVAQIAPADVEVHFVIAACENMISGHKGSMHPGDIITAMDGTTIEVNNTDAEGRLTLADALLYCQKQGVNEIVDVATLTGACMVALGPDVAGMWSNSDDVAQMLTRAAGNQKEKIWQMPLEEAYLDQLKSELADVKNAGTRFGGAITAALFLQRFVQKGVNWAHIDIAGTAWAEKAKGINGVGGTGSMVRTLTEFVVGRP